MSFCDGHIGWKELLNDLERAGMQEWVKSCWQRWQQAPLCLQSVVRDSKDTKEVQTSNSTVPVSLSMGLKFSILITRIPEVQLAR